MVDDILKRADAWMPEPRHENCTRLIRDLAEALRESEKGRKYAWDTHVGWRMRAERAEAAPAAAEHHIATCTATGAALAYVRDMARAYQETAVERARELAEARELLEGLRMVASASCKSTCVHETEEYEAVVNYLNRTRPASWIGSMPDLPEPCAKCGEVQCDCAAPTQAPECSCGAKGEGAKEPHDDWCEESEWGAPPTPAPRSGDDDE